MIRTTALWLFVTAAAFYSFKNWYRGVLALIALIAVVEHPDFPKSLAGIQGLNPWNILMVFVVIAWINGRAREKLTWDMERRLTVLLFFYAVIIVLAFLRAATDLGPVISFYRATGTDDHPSFLGLFSEHIINCAKWVVPAIMVYDGCRDRERLQETICVVIGVYFLLAVQVIRWMPFSSITGGGNMAERALKILSNEVGFHRVNLSMMFAGGAWAAYLAAGYFQQKPMRMAFYFAAAVITFGMMLTGGRTGYVTWALLGLAYAWFLNRKLLLLLPFFGAAALMVPGVQDRLLQGFTEDSVDSSAIKEEHAHGVGDGSVDIYTVTSGRTFAWKFVIPEIQESPWVGHGRMSMIRTGISEFLWVTYAEAFPHPHNMYLQWVLDNGILGAIPVFWFYTIVIVYAARMVRSGDQTGRAVGGLLLALVGSLFVAGMGSQTFYPREGAVTMWAAIMLVLRWYHLTKPAEDPKVEEAKARWAAPGAA